MKTSAIFLNSRQRAFTLVEVMLAMTVLAILMLVCTSALDQTQRSWQYARSKVDQFREARIAFDTITRHLAQAELNTYWDYYYKETDSYAPPEDISVPPSAYVRHSELQFQSGIAFQLIGPQANPLRYPGHAVFFQAPLGLSLQHPGLGSLLNARGYYVEFDSDETDKPPFIVERGVPSRYRYRLMEYRPPADRGMTSKSLFQGNTIYSKPADWFRQDISTASRVVAENILLLVIRPKVADSVAQTSGRNTWWIAPRYNYNSLDRDNTTNNVEGVRLLSNGTVDQGTQHLLPPLVEITMVAIDEASGQNWSEAHDDRPVNMLQEALAPFTDAAVYASDMVKLKTYLTGEKVNFRVFTATVALRNARWDTRSS